MMNDLTGIIAILSTIALPIALGMYMGIRAAKQKHIENMELIKQGLVPSSVSPSKSTPNSLRSLRNGILCVGVALGLLSSYLVTGSMQPTNEMVITSGGCILFFLGVAYIVYYFVSKDKLEGQDKQ